MVSPGVSRANMVLQEDRPLTTDSKSQKKENILEADLATRKQNENEHQALAKLREQVSAAYSVLFYEVEENEKKD